MATSRTSRATSPADEVNTPDAVKWIRWGLELLWLLTIVLVPLAFFRIVEIPLALPSPLEIAKIGLFRTLVALMAVLWLVEWTLVGKFPQGLFNRGQEQTNLDFSIWISRLKSWLQNDSTRYVHLAVLLFLTSVLLATVFSASLGVSLWGRVPGTDTTAAYTVACYLVLFAVVSTHLKTASQLWRLCGAIVAVGVFTGGYAVLQNFGLDFLELAVPRESRVRSTLGNPIFTGSFLLITITFSVVVASYHLGIPSRAGRFWLKTGLWSLVLAAQLAGSLFTLSRGPWGGTLVALVLFLAVAAVVVNWRTAAHGLLVLAVGVLLGVALSALVGLSSTESRWFLLGLDDTSVLGQIEERFTSVQLEGTSSSLGQRIGIWRVSSAVIRDRPWFEFEPLPFSWVRPVLGYGPDLFTPVFMLRSTPVGERLFPLETTHSHNYILHHWVELGVLGMLGAVSLYLVPMAVGNWQLFKRHRVLPQAYKLALIGVVAVVAGRFVEQMVGVAKVSDTTLFWVVLAVMVSLPTTMGPQNSPEPAGNAARQQTRRQSRNRNRAARQTSMVSLDPEAYARLSVAVVLIVGVIGLTWVRNVGNVNAVMQVSALNQTYQEGDLASSMGMLLQALDAAPNSYQYHDALDAVYDEYQALDQSPGPPECSLPSVAPFEYRTCLAERAYQGRLVEVEGSPWRWQSRLNLAEAAEELASLTHGADLSQEAVRRYLEASQMAPHSWKLQNQLAKAYISSGQPDAGLQVVEQSLAITGSTRHSAEAMLLRGLAHAALGQRQEALAGYNEAIALNPDYTLAFSNRANIYNQLGEYQLAIADLDQVTQLEPGNAGAYNNRGNAYFSLEEYMKAIVSYDGAIHLEPGYARAYGNRAKVYAFLDRLDEAIADFDQAIQLQPGFADAYVGRALAYAQTGRLDEARQDVESAVSLGVDRVALEKAINDAQSDSSNASSGG